MVINNKQKEKIILVEPAILALRIAYLASTNQEKGIFFRTTRKRLEKLAENKSSLDQEGDTEKDSKLNKAPITESYINCVSYELEKLDLTLIKADKEYLVCVAEDLHKVSLLNQDNAELHSLAEKELGTKVADFFECRKKKTSTENIKDKPIAENNEVALKDIWEKLVTHVQACLADNAETYIKDSEQLALTYEQLVNKLMYKIHRNGLASFLYSIEQYCNASTPKLPKLNYLVVKQGTKLPDGLKNTDSKAIAEFNNELEEIVEFVKNNQFPESPDIKYQKKNRPKNSKQLASKGIFTELDS